ncbi:hypothetical protein B9Z55_007566 [Caenorhabditis nigoni]|uniref:Uncharacterized protein n=2 Tax=Caenorhabditis nigoni TaxID=1611254 RepID=A0A2G5VA62_9PELO|nr:hypothetical protein B9Z55_007566 [Caenorhabditis nigoni]
MFAFKLVLVFLAIHLMATIDSEEPLYAAFATFPETNQTKMYNALGFYASVSKKMFEYDAKLPGANFKNYVWMNPCYRDFYASNASLVVFWLKDRVVYCQAVKSSSVRVQPSFAAEYLMRVERLGKRCPTSP